MGPLRRIRCPGCDATISVDWPRSSVAILFAWLIPVFTLIVFAELGIIAAIIFLVVSLVVVFLYQHYIVRLVVRVPPDNDYS